MKRKFSGVWATFEYLDDTVGAIKELRRQGFDHLTTHAPCPRHEIDEALGNAQSRVPYLTLIGAFVGGLIIVPVIMKMALDWILPVSSKPIVGIPSMGPVTFVFSVLMAVYFTVGGIGFFILKDMRKHPLPQSEHYKQYSRFMRDRFGVVVPCSGERIEKASAILRSYGAEEVNLEA